MKRLSEAQKNVLTHLTSGTGYHLRWEDGKGHLRVYASGGLRQAGGPIRPTTVGALVTRNLLDIDRLPSGSVTWHPSVEAWALAERGFRS